jgi:hypothetical protein
MWIISQAGKPSLTKIHQIREVYERNSDDSENPHEISRQMSNFLIGIVSTSERSAGKDASSWKWSACSAASFAYGAIHVILKM